MIFQRIVFDLYPYDLQKNVEIPGVISFLSQIFCQKAVLGTLLSKKRLRKDTLYVILWGYFLGPANPESYPDLNSFINQMKLGYLKSILLSRSSLLPLYCISCDISVTFGCFKKRVCTVSLCPGNPIWTEKNHKDDFF